MRFALPEADEEDSDVSSIYSFTSHEDVVAPQTKQNSHQTAIPQSGFGRRLHALIDESDSSTDTEADIDELGGTYSSSEDEDLFELNPRGSSRARISSTSGYSAQTSRSHPSLSETLRKSQTLWQTALIQPKAKAQGKGKAVAGWDELLNSKPTQYENWVKGAERAGMRVARTSASVRRQKLLEMKEEVQGEKDLVELQKLAREEEEMQRLLEGLVIRQNQDEEEMARRFSEREKQLWEDIDAAIRQVEQKAAQLRAEQAAAERKLREEEAAAAAAAEKAAQAKKAETERLVREKAEKERQDRLVKEAKEAEEAKTAQAAAASQAEKEKQRIADEERRKEADSKGKTSAEWRSWVDKQTWMKKEVIDVVKGNKETKAGLRMGMRLITRGLGQVVNTREAILRVTNDIHNILSEQLPSSPSPSAPTLLNQALPPAYAYLLSHLSKALIKQAESEVNAKADAAFPLARIVVGLLLRGHAALGEVFYARLVKKCPWIIPFYPSRQQGQSREDYEKSTGRGSDESIAEMVSRMTGIMTLYYAILQTPLSTLIPTIPAKPSPQQLAVLFTPTMRLPAAWTWIANALREPMVGMEPIAQLVTVWIQILAPDMIMIFGGKQVGKVFDAIQREGIEGGKVKGDSEAARQKLALVLAGRKELQYHPARMWA